MSEVWAKVEKQMKKRGSVLPMYGLLLAAVGCIGMSLKYIGPPAWVLGAMGILLLVASYLWEVYRK